MTTRPTLETDAVIHREYASGNDVVHADFARTLERQRDQARAVAKEAIEIAEKSIEEIALRIPQNVDVTEEAFWIGRWCNRIAELRRLLEG